MASPFSSENISIKFVIFLKTIVLAEQTADSSHGPSDTEKKVLPAAEKSSRRGRPRKKPRNDQDESLEKTKSVPENTETTSSGRPKRRAAKV